MNNVVRIRAGAPAPADTRRECRLSSDVIGELIQAGAHRRNALAANHTKTPMEREYDQFGTTLLEDLAPLITAAAVSIAAVAAVAAYFHFTH